MSNITNAANFNSDISKIMEITRLFHENANSSFYLFIGDDMPRGYVLVPVMSMYALVRPRVISSLNVESKSFAVGGRCDSYVMFSNERFQYYQSEPYTSAIT